METKSITTLLTISILLYAVNAFAAPQQAVIPWGTGDAPNASQISPETALGTIAASMVYAKANAATGGVALRNRETGSIGISGAYPPIRAAFIYWAVITNGAATAPDRSLMVQRQYPTPASSVMTVAGTLIGTGGSPCWPGNTISVFRAGLPLSLATGNGMYKVTILNGGAATTNGSDPWIISNVPLFEGASIVIVDSAAVGTVSIFDTGLAGKTFHSNPGLTYTLKLPVAAPGILTLFDNIGADGQYGTSRLATLGLSNELTTINGFKVAGPGSNYINSDWDGSSGFPLPQLWDDTGHDITVATPAGTTKLNFSITTTQTPYDCLTPVANIVMTQ